MSRTTLADIEWAHKPLGRAARIALGVAGLLVAFLFLMLAGSVKSGVWVLVVGGAALAATSVRAAWFPSAPRLLTLAANLLAIPLLAGLI